MNGWREIKCGFGRSQGSFGHFCGKSQIFRGVSPGRGCAQGSFFSFNAQPVPMNDNNTTIATSRRISIPNNSQDKSSKGRFDGVAFYTDDLTMSPKAQLSGVFLRVGHLLRATEIGGKVFCCFTITRSLVT